MIIENYFLSTTSHGDTVLHEACMKGRVDTITELAVELLNYPNKKASLDFLLKKNDQKQTAFDLLSHQMVPGREAIAEILIYLLSELTTRKPPIQQPAVRTTPLIDHWSGTQPPDVSVATVVVPKIFERLMKKQYDGLIAECSGEEVNMIFKQRTPLTYCIATDNRQGVKVLLEHPGIDLELQDGTGRSPLEVAMLHKRSEMIDWLWETSLTTGKIYTPSGSKTP